MKFSEASELDKKHVFQTYRRTPLMLDRGAGVYVYDDSGNRYLDFVTGLAVNALGHCNKRVAAAISAQARRLSHVSNLYYTEPMLRLAGRLTSLSGMDKAFFCNSGAEANEAAIKLVRRFHSEVLNDGRHEIICFKNSFHGRTLMTLTATGQDVYKKGFDPLAPGFKHAIFNDIDSVEKAITKKTAAIMIEPVQGEAGIYPASPKFMRGLAALRNKHGIQLIFDEVQCGMGRTGTWFAFEHYRVRPDAVTLAKPIGGGLPLGVMMARGKLAEGFAPGAHATTFGGGPVACAAANAFLDEVEEKKLLVNVKTTGERITADVEKLRRSGLGIREVRGKGLMLAVELENDIAADAAAFFMQNGVLINAIRSNIIRILPPFIIEKKHAGEFTRLLEEFLRARASSEKEK